MLILGATVACVATCAFAAEAPSKVTKAKNVILFIGDGMALPQVAAAAFQAYGQELDADGNPPRLSFEEFPVVGYITSFSAGGLVTDSSAAGTALASGVKTKNGMLGVTPDMKPLKNIAEYAREAGKAVGVLSSVGLNHATPACFYAHQKGRGDYDEITTQIFETNTVDVLMGGGIYRDQYTEKQIRDRAAETGFKVFDCNNFADLTPANVGAARVLGLFDTNDNKMLDFESSRSADCREPHLSEMTAKALALLAPGKKGFFLMVESGSIDWACHGNNAVQAIGEVKELDRTVAQTVEFLKREKMLDDTLIIVTADHETGGMTIPGPYKPTLKPGELPEIRFVTKDHTALPPMIWSRGPGSEMLGGKNDNTHVFRTMLKSVE